MTTCIPVHTRVRTNVTLTINPQLVAKAHELGLNVSRITELALSKAITSLEQSLEVTGSPDPEPRWARSLVRTRTLRKQLTRKPAEPEIRGSNPRGPATFHEWQYLFLFSAHSTSEEYLAWIIILFLFGENSFSHLRSSTMRSLDAWPIPCLENVWTSDDNG